MKLETFLPRFQLLKFKFMKSDFCGTEMLVRSSPIQLQPHINILIL